MGGGLDHTIWVWIGRYLNRWQSDYLKEGTSSNTGINWSTSSIEKLIQIGHNQCMYSNVVVQKKLWDGLLKQ